MGSLRKDVDVGRNPEELHATTLPKLAISIVMRICLFGPLVRMECEYFSMTQIIDIKERSMNGFTFVGDLVLRPVILGI